MEERVGDPFSDLFFAVRDTVSARDTLAVEDLQVEVVVVVVVAVAVVVGAVVASMR